MFSYGEKQFYWNSLRTWTWPVRKFVDLGIKPGGFHSYVSLPEGNVIWFNGFEVWMMLVCSRFFGFHGEVNDIWIGCVGIYIYRYIHTCQFDYMLVCLKSANTSKITCLMSLVGKLIDYFWGTLFSGKPISKPQGIFQVLVGSTSLKSPHLLFSCCRPLAVQSQS